MTGLLRALALAASLAVLAAGSVLLFWGGIVPGLIWCGFGVAMLAGTLYERVHYKPVLAKPPGGNFQKTPERFLDPQTGNPITVYVDNNSGERLYVQE